ncbi:MAG: P-loop NTPase [SAR324 cluster bacterium]|nr:P-loop NTPase [SAR324 cluster bacterium]
MENETNTEQANETNTEQANETNTEQAPGPVLIPVASGKGGVGKTFMVANLAIALAQLGKRVIAADLDFGGSNLYTHLGFDNRHPGIAHFISSRDTRLEELLVKTPFDGLWFLPGEARMPFLANMGHSHKQKLLLNLTKLDADYVLLDLGAGTSFTVLDFFSISTRGMLVTTLDYPSLINMLQFLKNFALRVVERALPPKSYLRTMVAEYISDANISDRLTIRDLFHRLEAEYPDEAQRVQELWGTFRPHIVFNQGKHPDEMIVVENLQDSLAANLSLKVDFFGCVFHDDAVGTALQHKHPFLDMSADSPAAEDLYRLADRVIRLWDAPIRNSGQLLRSNTLKIYTDRQAE